MSARMVKTNVPGIFKRGGRYVVTFRDAQGRSRKKSAATMVEARALKASVTADVARGEFRSLSRATLREYATEWIEGYQGRTSRGFRETTRQEYRRDLERDIVPYLGARRLTEIEPRDIKQFASYLATKRNLSPASVRLVIAPLRALLATAFEEGLIRSNPAANVRLAPTRKHEVTEDVKAMTATELAAVVSEIPDPYRLFFRVLAESGMRIGEAIAVRWTDIDFDRGRVRVHRRWYRGAYGPPKSKYGVRSIPLSTTLLRDLWQAREAAGTIEADTLAFTTPSGDRLDTSNLRRRVLKPAAMRARVPWIGFHAFRHTCATILFRRGLNAKQVQMWLGHHSPAFTLSTYVHLLTDDLPAVDFFATAAPVGSPVGEAAASQAIAA
jgi:integrase